MFPHLAQVTSFSVPTTLCGYILLLQLQMNTGWDGSHRELAARPEPPGAVLPGALLCVGGTSFLLSRSCACLVCWSPKMQNSGPQKLTTYLLVPVLKLTLILIFFILDCFSNLPHPQLLPP